MVEIEFQIESLLMIGASEIDPRVPRGQKLQLESTTVPLWMRRILLAAAAYNLIWGAFAILSPLTIFRMAGFNPLPGTELWQCIGMIVGVYGIGYGIAALDPVCHWPIVLVGLLGKICGPIGFIGAVSSGRFPAVMGWTILTNDLIWWVPFSLILWKAAQVHIDR
ncbi:MAG TPA: hypothetical protein PLY87_23240 [Planctomycetaceae bacterium]|nr:hypothetical protein [Planctomycetaceae bacterium]HQZ68033.1 hypothetical protein [Planctomycetaceae bacterium]